MKKPRDWFSTLAIIGGLLLVLYPTISNVLNLFNATRVLEQYSEAVDELTDEEAAQLMEAARVYNAKLAGLRASRLPKVAGMPLSPRWLPSFARSTAVCSTSRARV